MRLDRLDLTRYGRFTDAQLHFPRPENGAPDFHIIYGPNEAGKSTLFSAWLDFLYGIPLRTRYDFLHGGPNMRIGAQISHAGGSLDLVRIKKNSASLIDAQGQALPETVLQSLLSGLSREGYGAMFSLDDETIERGGDSILASKGDLGEMLFSASAGLAGIGPQLDARRGQLEAFHKIGGRKGALREARLHLADLDRKRREIDTSAAAFRRLTSEVSGAETLWREARQQEDLLDRRIQHLRDLQSAQPLRARLEALRVQSQDLVSLPIAGEDEARRFHALEAARIALTSRIETRAPRLLALSERLGQNQPDARILAQQGAIADAEGLFAEDAAAAKDLPRRRAEAEDAAAETRDILGQLDRRGANPADLVLDPLALSQLRALLTRYSALEAGLAHARREAEAAEQRLAQESRALGDLGSDVEGAALAALMADLRQSDPAGMVQRAQRERDLCSAALRSALTELSPWQGEARDLLAQNVPASWQIEAWRHEGEQTRQAEAEARSHQTRAADDLAEAQAEDARRRAAQGAGAITLADLDAIRSAREALWSDHRSQLNAQSAAAFEAKLREDDRASAMLATALSDARRLDDLSSKIAQLEVISRKSEIALEQAQTARHAHLAALAQAATGLGIAGASLDDLAGWLARRSTALLRHDALCAAEDQLTTAEAGLAAGAAALRDLLGQGEGPEQGFAALWARALAREAEAEQCRAARLRLRELTGARDLRVAEQDSGEAALADWQKDWAGAVRGSLLDGRAIDVAAMSDLLERLDSLGRAEARRASLADRVEKMEANRKAFAGAFAAIREALGAPDGLAWADLQQQLRQAEDQQAKHAELAAELADEQEAEAEDREAMAANEADLAGLGRQLGWQAEAGPTLAEHLALCLEAGRLAGEIRALEQDLEGRALPDPAEDSADLAAQISAAASDVELARNRTQELFAALSEARRRLAAVGGDDAVAQIEAERANILNGLHDDARNYLRQSFGLMALEQGLRRYRDNHRSAMLGRASAAFEQLSRGAYRNLVAEPNGASEVLMALPAQGGAKLAVDMSKGTRFQLYLALRIAGYHELAVSRPMVPFIADDIMETFDDDRAHEAFLLLAAMAERGQVIYLTHNRHLCEIARAAAPKAQILNLEQI